MTKAPKLQPVRGTHDILPEESRRRRYIVDSIMQIAGRYGFGEIATPIFEFSDVFHRTLGDASDVVSKETYSFEDRGGESLTLRPEFTASVVRAFLSNGLQQNLPCRFAYHGPAFRYERPQKGRMRQFHQIGVEVLGVAEPMADIEVIALAHDCLTALGLKDAVTLELNSLGDEVSRLAYREALVEYFSQHKAKLSEDSLKRLEKNPLRILDSKDEDDRALIADAPTIQVFYTAEAKAFFEEVTKGLEALDIAYTHNPQLVRGLDYYSHSVFEFTCDRLGAQATVLAGGRYDGLVELMGGQSTPGIGWAAGMERLLLAMDAEQLPESERPVALIPLGDAAQAHALKLAHQFRQAGIFTLCEANGAMGKRLKKATRVNAKAAVIFGDDELASGEFQLKWLDSGEQLNLSLDGLFQALKAS
jgi:histidyl-tRNA synthetase